MQQSSDIPVVGPLALIEPFSAKSTAPGVPVGNIGLTQDFSELGLPATIGVGFVTTAGAFVDYRHVPESNGTNAALAIFNLPVSLGVDLTDRWSIGASTSMGIAFFDGPFVGFGPANTSLMDGRLLLAYDVVYKMWDEAALYDSIYDNQWVVQLGAQYTQGRYRFRSGYVWAENPLDETPGNNLGGVIQPGDLAVVRYSQGLLAVTSQHRISFGVGIADVLPGVDMDMMAGGMFRDSQQLGNFTNTSIESYWIGLGLTWRFGRGACGPVSAPDRWCSN